MNGVAATGCKAWAVGSYTARGGTRTLILYWNGKRWKVQPSPNPGPFPRHDELSGVTATSPTDAWAVGHYKGRAERTLVEHWNGTAWKVQKSANTGGSTSDNTLAGVTATSSTNAWAVGSYDNGSGSGALIEHWNVTAWKVQKSPNVGGTGTFSRLYGVAATSAKNAWAVGSGPNGTLVEHWNGTAWKVQKSPNPVYSDGLSSVAATSAKNAWAVGGSEFGKNLVEHWNGTAWNAQKSPSRRNSGFFGVAATSRTNAWAV